MSKIQTIKLKNFKAISELEMDFNGCTAIITAGNNKGKTSFLRGMVDRIRFVRPDVMVKRGEEEGSGEMTLDSGEKFLWQFDNKSKDKLMYVTAEGFKSSVTKEVGSKFFPPTFDIDKFLQSAPKDQAKQLQKIVGLDFTDIDDRYAKAYQDRTEKNREAEKFHVKLSKMLKMDMVLPVDLSELQAKKDAENNRLNELFKQNQKTNDSLRFDWDTRNDLLRQEAMSHNAQQVHNKLVYETCFDAAQLLEAHGLGDTKALNEFLDKKKNDILPDKTFFPLPEPEYISLLPDASLVVELDAKILAASEINTKAAEYLRYKEYKDQTEAAKELSDQADFVVKQIEDERQAMIQSAKFPEGVSISAEGITIDGFPLDRNQISTSKLYTAALRIAAMNLGEVKTLYFDASFLDKISLGDIEQWARENDLQLLIERPDWEGDEIKYELIDCSE